MKRNLRLSFLGPSTAFFCEFLGLIALAISPEVERPLFLAPLVIGALAWLARVRLPNLVLLLLVAALVAIGYATAGAETTGTIVARALIPGHALLWLSAEERVYRFWRLGVAMLELVLATILSPEVSMFVFTFLFVLVSSLALSLGFLEREFNARDPSSLQRPLRGSFVLAILAVSLTIFLSGLLIFPLLPRARWDDPPELTNVGYKDVISFQQGIGRWGTQEGGTALWIFRQDGRPWQMLVPGLLLRGQSLEHFDGHSWRPMLGPYVPPLSAAHPEGTIEIHRKAFPSDILLLPYGVVGVSGAEGFQLGRRAGGEWLANGSSGNSVRYQVSYGNFRPDELGAAPNAEDFAFDPKMLPEISLLAKELSQKAPSDEARILAVSRYFHDRGFAYELLPVEAYHVGARHPIEKFLFTNKRGHCELFAASAALLLRAMGLPARLAVGFRVRPPLHGADVLTVKSSDAHAWVEVWTKGKGWRPFDPTPSAPEAGWYEDLFSDTFDWIGAYWNRYILEYEFSLPALQQVLGWPALIFGLLLMAMFWRRGWRIWMRGRPRDGLGKVLLRFEDDLIHQAGLYPEMAYREIVAAREWRAHYTDLRFGRAEPTSDDLWQLRDEARAIIVKASESLWLGS